MKTLIVATLIAALLVTGGCASRNQTPPQASAAGTGNPPESLIEGNFPPDSAFAKIRLGMAQGQIHEILGQPNDTKYYQTGKAWIPFYFGQDTMRADEFYKGVGVLTFTGAGIGGVHWKLFRAVYDPSEDGYPNN